MATTRKNKKAIIKADAKKVSKNKTKSVKKHAKHAQKAIDQSSKATETAKKDASKAKKSTNASQKVAKNHNPKPSEETQKVINEAREEQNNSRSKLPSWMGKTKKGKHHYAKPDELGQYLYDKHKNEWLLVRDGDKSEFWTYAPLKHDYSGDDIAKKVAKTQKVWKLSDIKSIKGVIHSILNKYHCWTSSKELDTYRFIVGALEDASKEKNNTVGTINPDMMLTADGIIDASTGNIYPNSPRYYFTDFADYSIAHSSVEGCQHILKWFKDTFEDEAITLEQYIGYMLFTNYRMVQGFLILINTGGEGKTTIINFINSLMPKNEVSDVSIQQLTQSEKLSKNFSISELYKKRLDTADDITNQFIVDGSKLKTLTGGGWLNASVKGKKDIRFTSYAKLLFACNDLPSFKDTSNGWARRPYIIRAHSINFGKKYDMKQIYNERGSFMLYCLKAFKKQYNAQISDDKIINPRFTETKQMKDDLAKWLYDNDPIKQFISERVVAKKDLPDKGKHTLKNCRKAIETYNAYTEWAKDARIEPIGRNKFYNALRTKGYEVKRTTIGGITTNWILDCKLDTDRGNIEDAKNDPYKGLNDNVIDMPKHK